MEKLDKKIFNLDKLVLARGFVRIGGIDEAGRGALAGPFVAACVILDHQKIPPGIADSKILSDVQRRELYPHILECAVSVGIGIATHLEIDRVNVLNATKLAMLRAFQNLSIQPDILLIDAIKLNDIPINSISVVRGESKSVSIAAASVIAKVYRDDLMIEYSERYPEYSFSENKGYGTSYHRRALLEYGPCEIHRVSYAPVIEALKKCKLRDQKEEIQAPPKSSSENSP